MIDPADLDPLVAARVAAVVAPVGFVGSSYWAGYWLGGLAAGRGWRSLAEGLGVDGQSYWLGVLHKVRSAALLVLLVLMVFGYTPAAVVLVLVVAYLACLVFGRGWRSGKGES